MFDYDDLTTDQQELIDTFGEKVVKEWLEEAGLEVDDISKFDAESGIVEAGRQQEWIAFESLGEAERYAKNRIEDLYEDLGHEAFSPGVVDAYIFIDSAMAAQLAAGMLDDYGDRYDFEEIVDELDDSGDGLREKMVNIEAGRNRAVRSWREIEEKLQEEDISPRTRENLKERDKEAERRYKVVVSEQQELMEDALDRLREQVEEEYAERIEEDPLDYLQEMGITVAEAIKQNIVQVDEEKLIEDVVDLDGLGHTIATYDGEELEIDGTYWFRLN